MIYAISDIHGCYASFRELLEKIHFSDEDELYIVGDVMDRGPEPIALLLDLMERPNIYPIMGNHDYMALSVLRKLNVEVTEENVENHLTADDLISYMHWVQDGGEVTAKAFRALDAQQREAVLEYMEEFALYEEVSAGGRDYVLVHAGIHGFEETKDLSEYAYQDFLFYRADYTKRYFSDRYLLTGHTPTFKITGEHQVLEQNGHIAIDCGCVYGGRLAAYCLDDGTVTYVEGKNRI